MYGINIAFLNCYASCLSFDLVTSIRIAHSDTNQGALFAGVELQQH